MADLCWPKGEKIDIVVAQKENEAVLLACGNLVNDLKASLAAEAVIKKVQKDRFREDGDSRKRIIIASAADKNCLPEEFFDERGGLRAEAYAVSVKEQSVCITGTDRRGVIYGIYHLSRLLGVSPWYYFADVPVKKKERFTLPQDYCKTDWPCVAYRGIFLNDEEELEHWANRHTKDKTIGPQLYEKIYELLLRLGANYLWPAMHVNYFNENPKSGMLADKMGIVIGTSHCDMLLRSNQNEWSPWLKKKGYENIRYDYSVSDENRDILREYWRESVEMNRGYEVCYTVGMRGVHDYGFSTVGIDRDETLTEEEKQKKRVELLGRVIRDQRELLKDVTGTKDHLQIFIPYKEVLPLYDDGLELPEDITLMWVDDNFGYMRRYPNEEEKKRSGGHGLYYHASYWAHPGMSYLFLNSIPLRQTQRELKKCYENQIKKIWVLNVGALKPLEQEIEFFIRCGWDIGKGDAKGADPEAFLTGFIDENFSGGHGAALAPLYERFLQIANVCKPEHMRSFVFAQSGYGDEALLRINELQEIAEKTFAVYESLPREEKDAFYQLFLFKMTVAYLIYASFYYADKSRICYDAGDMRNADECLERSRSMDEKKRNLIAYYNHTMANGKWDGIMTPEQFSPPPTALYPAGKPALVIEKEKSGQVNCSDQKKEKEEPVGAIELDLRAGCMADGGNGNAARSGWVLLPGLGRGYGDAVEFREEGEGLKLPFVLAEEGCFELELWRYLTLHSTGSVWVRIQIDEAEPIAVTSEINDEWKGDWRYAVMNDGESLSVMLPKLSAGRHMLTLLNADRYFTVTHIFLYTKPKKPCNLGPLYCEKHKKYQGEEKAFSYADSEVFRTQTNPLPMLYADSHFHEIDRLYIQSDERVEKPYVGKRYEKDENGCRNVFAEFGKGVVCEQEGKIALDAEIALENSAYAYINNPKDTDFDYEHTQAESYHGRGIAMMFTEKGHAMRESRDIVSFEKTASLNYRIKIEHAGTYYVWLLVKFDDDASDSCYLALDGQCQEQYADGNLFTYSMKQRWNWHCAARMTLAKGEHTFTIGGRKTGLRIDRIYFSKTTELPPEDGDWISSDRKKEEKK